MSIIFQVCLLEQTVNGNHFRDREISVDVMEYNTLLDGAIEVSLWHWCAYQVDELFYEIRSTAYDEVTPSTGQGQKARS